MVDFAGVPPPGHVRAAWKPHLLGVLLSGRVNHFQSPTVSAYALMQHSPTQTYACAAVLLHRPVMEGSLRGRFGVRAIDPRSSRVRRKPSERLAPSRSW